MPRSALKISSISPDPQSLKRLLDELPDELGYVTAFDDSSLAVAHRLGVGDESIELLSFGDLLGRICMDVGIPTSNLASRGRLLAAYEVACHRLERTRVFKNCKDFAGFHESVSETLRELHHWGIDAEKLVAAGKSIPGAEGQKLLELAEIDQSVSQLMLKVGSIQPYERARALLSEEFSRPLHFKILVVLTNSEVRPIYHELLKKLSLHGVRVHVVLEKSDGVFEGSRLIAKSFGTEPKRFGADSWAEGLFQSEKKADPPAVEIFDAPDALSEAEWALRKCQEAIAEGVLPHRIAIHASDQETYVPYLKSTARRFDLMLDARHMMPLLTIGFASLTMKVLEALSAYNPKSLIQLATSSYFPTTREARLRLADAVHDAIRKGDESWAAIEKSADEMAELLPWLWPLLRWRAKSISQPYSMPEWHGMLDDFFRIEVIERNAQNGVSKKQSHDQRAQMAMMRSLAEYAPTYDAEAEEKITFSEFVGICARLWDREEVISPTDRRGIRVVSKSTEVGEADIVIVMGMLEGVMPKRRTEDPILSDEERAGLTRALGLEFPLLDSGFEARAQRDAFVRLCAAAKQKLILSYPRADEERLNVPASYLSEIRALVGDAISTSSFTRAELVPQSSDCRNYADLRIAEALALPREDHMVERLKSEAAREIVRPDFESRIEVREVVDATECLFKSNARYRLGIHPNSKGINSLLRRLPAMAQLRSQPDAESARAALEAALSQSIADRSTEIEKWEESLIEATAMRQIDQWIEAEFAAREIWKLEPAQTNVGLDHPVFRPSLKIGNTKIQFKAKVDGISELGPYLVIHRFFQPNPSTSFEKSPGVWLEIAILYALSKTHNSSQIFDLDLSSGGRLALTFNKADGVSLASNSRRHLSTRQPVDTRGLLDFLKEELDRATFRLETGNMVATPGEHCENCAFGELCRVSREHNDFDLQAGGATWPS